MIIHSQQLELSPQPILPNPNPPPFPQPPQKNKRIIIQIQLPHPEELLLAHPHPVFVVRPHPQPVAVKSLMSKTSKDLYGLLYVGVLVDVSVKKTKKFQQNRIDIDKTLA